ncbi:hypothetical protein XENOCAPTIV_019135, partial [Xenoophorus captivus]
LYANLPEVSVPLNVYSSWGGVNCHVKLTSLAGSLIRLTVTSFLIEPTDCVNDGLMVYDALLPMRGRILHRLSDPRYWSAHLGMLTQGSAKHVAEIQRIVVHEYYNAYTFDYDIALLQLKKPWPPSLRPLVQPVCLPPSSHTVTDRHRCLVTGWGYRSEEGW